MSSSQLSMAHARWRARRERAGGSKASTLYSFVIVGAIIVVPLVRVLSTVAGSPGGQAALSSPDASAAVSILVAALWGGALLVGRKRGPALLPPFLLHALTGSGIRRALTLRMPVLRSATMIVAGCVAGAAFVAVSLLGEHRAGLWDVAGFVVAAATAGVVTAALWLVGQVFPRIALPSALTVLVIAVLSFSAPQTLAFTPWGWVGSTYPLAGSGAAPFVGTVVLAAASIIVIPVLLDRLTGVQLSAQAAQWERATAFVFSFDLRAATAVYEAEPQVGRTIPAVTPRRHRWVTFFIRDVVGQARTPIRSFGAIAATAAAGSLMALSFLAGMPAALLAAAAGVVMYGATRTLAKGVQHAASVAGDYPLYGISDRRLMLVYSLFPIAAMLTIQPIAGGLTALVGGFELGFPLAGACALGVLALALRLGSALKGPLPAILLTPVTTPAGDLSAVVRLVWAFCEPLIAVCAALAITVLPVTPLPLALLSISVGALVLARWKGRR